MAKAFQASAFSTPAFQSGTSVYSYTSVGGVVVHGNTSTGVSGSFYFVASGRVTTGGTAASGTGSSAKFYTSAGSALARGSAVTSCVFVPSKLRFYSSAAGTNNDYLGYLYDTPVKDDRENDVTLLDFSLVPKNASFVKLLRGNYVTLETDTYGKWFTGYISEEPAWDYLGKDSVTKQGVWGYKYRATSDEIILNKQSIGAIPPYANTTMGAILKDLADILAHGVFDVTGVMNGQTLARYVCSPDKKFGDVAKEFADMANYRYRIHDHKIVFEPKDQTAATIAIDGNSKWFTPSRLDLKASADSLVNDVLVMGDVEPQGKMTEYFFSDGITSDYPLMSGVYGVEKTVLLDEQFSGNSLDANKWVEYDDPQNWIAVNNGYLNIVGGNGVSYSHIDSADVIPLQGTVYFTHGEWDFLAAGDIGIGENDGVIGGLWTGPVAVAGTQYHPPTSACLYGIAVSAGTPGTTRRFWPAIRGVWTGDVVCDIDFSKRYVVRTVVQTQRVYRSEQSYSYIGSDGLVHTNGGGSYSDTFTFTTYITPIDPLTGVKGTTVTWMHTTTAAANEMYVTYVPVATRLMHATVTNITVNVPMQGELTVAGKQFIVARKSSVDAANAYSVNVKSALASSGYRVDVNLTATVEECKAYKAAIVDCYAWSAAEHNAFIQQLLADGQTVIVQGNDSGAGLFYFGGSVAANPVGVAQKVGSHTLHTGWTALPSDTDSGTHPTGLIAGAVRFLEFSDSNPAGIELFQTGGHLIHIVPLFGTLRTTADGRRFISNVASYLTGMSSKWVGRILGPNTIDGYDGMSPTATLSVSGGGISTRSAVLGTPKYNPGDPTLKFFKDSVNLSTSVPTIGELIRIRYNRAGVAMGRVRDTASVAAEAVAWGDNGVRSMAKKDLSPKPRNSVECELAASALVGDLAYKRFSGSYSQYSNMEFTGEPLSGTVLKFKNLPVGTFGVASFNEVINSVKTTFLARAPKELFQHDITFGPPDNVRALIADWNKQKDVFFQEDAAEVPDYIPNSSVGLAFSDDVLQPEFISWDANNLSFDIGQDPPVGGGFEVRYTDAGWGDANNKNLVYQGTSRTFTVPRTLRSRAVFVKTYDAADNMARYTAGVRVVLPMIPPAPVGGTLVVPQGTDVLHPYITVGLPMIMSDVWGVEVRASNNITVLYNSSLIQATYYALSSDSPTAPGYDPYFVFDNSVSKTRVIDVYMYTFNLLGEYSAPYHFTYTIPTPSIVQAGFQDHEQNAWCSVLNTTNVHVELFLDSGLTNIYSISDMKVIAGHGDNVKLILNDAQFFPLMYFRYTPQDDLGSGTPVVVSHQYVPSGVTSFDNTNNIKSVVGSTTWKTYTGAFAPNETELNTESFLVYAQNKQQ